MVDERKEDQVERRDSSFAGNPLMSIPDMSSFLTALVDDDD